MEFREALNRSNLANDRGIGFALLLGSIAGILIYGWLLWSFATLVLQVTAFVAVATLLAILGWIGWTMASTPPVAPVLNAVTSSQEKPTTLEQERK